MSKLWKREIDSSPEYACLRLAKWNYVLYSGRHWTPKDEYEAYRFNLNWNVFRTSWSLANPINNDRLETTSLGELSCPELDQLRSLLRDNGNRSLDVQPGEKISPRPGIWVSPKNRWDGFRDEKGYWPLEKIIIVLYIFWTYNCYLLQLYVHIIVLVSLLLLSKRTNFLTNMVFIFSGSSSLYIFYREFQNHFGTWYVFLSWGHEHQIK